VSLVDNIANRRVLMLRLIMAELLAKRGEGPLALKHQARAGERREHASNTNVEPGPKP